MLNAPDIIRNSSLPSPSPVLVRLHQFMSEPDYEIGDLANVMEGDATLTARVIRVANAAIASPVNRIDNLRDAVVRIGLLSTTHIIFCTEMSKVFTGLDYPYDDLRDMWKHNLMVASLSEALANTVNADRPGAWFTAGLLHDIGRLLLISDSPGGYRDVLASVAEGVDIREAERRRFGFSHDVAGAYLLSYWRFPIDLVDAVADHHKPTQKEVNIRYGIFFCNRYAHSLSNKDSVKYAFVDGVNTEKLFVDAAPKFELMKEAMSIN